jgi:hypothetical protein
MNGRQDACGMLIPDTSLKLLMANCVDFEEQESLLQANGHKMGVKNHRSATTSWLEKV